MTINEIDKVRRMMRKVAAMSADLEKIAFNQHTQEDSSIFYDCSQMADKFGHKLNAILESDFSVNK